METVIVSNRTRQIVKISKNITYIYIPLSQEEIIETQTKTINPCWRITITK